MFTLKNWPTTCFPDDDDEQHKALEKASPVFRTLIALPFLAIATILAFRTMHHLNAAVEDQHNDVKNIEWETSSLSSLDSFFHFRFLDGFWQAPASGIDEMAWYQMLTLLNGVSLVYSLWLFEAVRNVRGGMSRFPIVFGSLSQLLGFGIGAPLYYFFHYTNSTPLDTTAATKTTTTNTPSKSEFKSKSKSRKTDTSYTSTVFWTMLIFSYIPINLLMYLSKSPINYHHTNPHPLFRTTRAIWLIFPLCISLSQLILSGKIRKIRFISESSPKTPATSATSKEINNPNRDITTIRATIGLFAAISAKIWINTLITSPHSLTTIFLPAILVKKIATTTADHTTSSTPPPRHFTQLDHQWVFASSFLWLAYLFTDLKRAGRIQQSWAMIFLLGVLLTACFGPGVAVAGAWLWRDEVLRRAVY